MSKNSIASNLLKNAKSSSDRAGAYITSIERNLKASFIDQLTVEIEKTEDQLNDAKDFSLTTDLNAGVKALTREESEKRFKLILDLEYKLKLMKLELEEKTKIYNQYFSEISETVSVEEG